MEDEWTVDERVRGRAEEKERSDERECGSYLHTRLVEVWVSRLRFQAYGQNYKASRYQGVAAKER
jgi:hypothetical protein